MGSKPLRLFVAINILLLFALSLESIPLPVQVQIMPLSGILALFFLPFILTRVRITPLFKTVIIFVIFVLLHSVVALFVDIVVLGVEEIRVITWARQVIALIMGLSVFLVLRKTLVNVSDRFIVHAVIAGALPALALALLNVLWGLTGSSLAGDIVTGIRSAIITRGYTSPLRASGFSLEPSSFAFYLAIIVIPMAIIMVLQPHLWKRRIVITLLICALIAFGWTFSTTGFIVLVAVILAGMVLGPNRWFFATMGLLGSIGVITIVILFPDNYALQILKALLTKEETVSFTDRFYSTFGPIVTAFSSYTLLGYGLGGTTTHFAEIVPPAAQEAIASVRWEGMPSLATLVGRLLAETGIWGILLFFLMISKSWQQTKSLIKFREDGLSQDMIRVSRLALVGYLIGAAIGWGSFALPYLWFWLAVIDSRYILQRRFAKEWPTVS